MRGQKGSTDPGVLGEVGGFPFERRPSIADAEAPVTLGADGGAAPTGVRPSCRLYLAQIRSVYSKPTHHKKQPPKGAGAPTSPWLRFVRGPSWLLVNRTASAGGRPPVERPRPHRRG